MSYLSNHLRHLNHEGLNHLQALLFSPLLKKKKKKDRTPHFYIRELFPLGFEMSDVSLNLQSLCSDLQLITQLLQYIIILLQ